MSYFSRGFNELFFLRSHIARIHGLGATIQPEHQGSHSKHTPTHDHPEPPSTFVTNSENPLDLLSSPFSEYFLSNDYLLVSRNVYDFYNDFADETIPIFIRKPVLSTVWETLSHAQKV